MPVLFDAGINMPQICISWNKEYGQILNIVNYLMIVIAVIDFLMPSKYYTSMTFYSEYTIHNINSFVSYE